MIKLGLVLLLVLLPQALWADITTNVLACWRLNDGSGTTALSTCGGGGNNGTLGASTATPTWASGATCIANGCLTFDGGDSVSVPTTNMALTVTTSYTWAFWLYPGAFTEFQPVWFSLVVADTTYLDIVVHTTTDTTWGPVTAGLTAAWVTNAGSAYVITHTTDNALTLNTWAHVAIVYDASQVQASRFRLYVNAVDVTATGDVASIGTIGSMTPTSVLIGNDTSATALTGRLDEFYLFTRALNVYDIQELAGQMPYKRVRVY